MVRVVSGEAYSAMEGDRMREKNMTSRGRASSLRKKERGKNRGGL